VLAGEIRGLVAGVATHAGHTMAILAAPYILQMDVTVVALQRRVTGRMAVLTTRRSEDFVDLQESFARRVGIGFGAWRRGVNGGHQYTEC
jgi:hypothetical protein